MNPLDRALNQMAFVRDVQGEIRTEDEIHAALKELYCTLIASEVAERVARSVVKNVGRPPALGQILGSPDPRLRKVRLWSAMAQELERAAEQDPVVRKWKKEKAAPGPPDGAPPRAQKAPGPGPRDRQA